MYDPSIFSISTSLIQDIPLLLGGVKKINYNIKNMSSLIRLYNLSLKLTLPDGITLQTSDIPYTSKFTNSTGATLINFTNLKDLAQSEIDFYFSFEVKSSLFYNNNLPVQFETLLQNIIFYASIDSMPRGNLDSNNTIYEASNNLSFTIVLYTLEIIAASKMLKGAGYKNSAQNIMYPYSVQWVIKNNFKEDSYLSFEILLDDGVRHVGEISTAGENSSQFQAPIIIQENDTITNKLYTKIYFQSLKLSIGSTNTVTTICAIWNKYNNNSGEIILHGSNIYFKGSIIGQSYSCSNSYTTKSMDIIINKSSSSKEIDVNDTVNFNLSYKVCQYFKMNQIVINDMLPNGFEFINSMPEADNVTPDDVNKITKLTYNLGDKSEGYNGIIVITASVNSLYSYETQKNVLSGDEFTNIAELTSINSITLGISEDSSSISMYIKKPRVSKNFVKAYYRNGFPKSIETLAPLDLAEFKLIYDSLGINAVQQDIYIDDFLPLSVSPISNILYYFSGLSPLSTIPQLINPHGVSFFYGNVSSNGFSEITVLSPISDLSIEGGNINLLKMKGINTKLISYSSRAQIPLKFGTPNILLSKTVSGPNKNAIKAGEYYLFTISVLNTSNIGNETDAFDFDLLEEISPFFDVNPLSIVVSGDGDYVNPTITTTDIKMHILSLYKGQSLNINYSAIIKNGIAPKVTITTKASTSNPYSQIYNEQLSNYQYTNLEKSAYITLKTASPIITKTVQTQPFKVGSTLFYTITLSIPHGTKAYNSVVKDTLPQGQNYLGPCYKDGLDISPTVSGQDVIMPEEAEIDSTLNTKTIAYTFYASLTNANKTINSITSTQTNNVSDVYKTEPKVGNLINISKSLNVTINHPNISLNLTGKELNSLYYSTLINSSSNTDIMLNLAFENNSKVNIKDCIIEIPIDSQLIFKSTDEQYLSSLSYNSSSKKVIIQIQSLNAGQIGYSKFILKTIDKLFAGTSIPFRASAIQYKNDLSITKIYSGEYSNNFIINVPTSLSFIPNVLNKIDDKTSYTVSTRGTNINIINHLINNGNGIDSYLISIEPVIIDYSIYIDNIKLADVLKNTIFSVAPDILKNIFPKKLLNIVISTTIPLSIEKNTIIRFIVTINSLNSPYPSKTITNIDPS